eukprot:6173005-Pleurochrysis_carterae.AAC.1
MRAGWLRCVALSRRQRGRIGLYRRGDGHQYRQRIRRDLRWRRKVRVLFGSKRRKGLSAMVIHARGARGGIAGRQFPVDGFVASALSHVGGMCAA